MEVREDSVPEYRDGSSDGRIITLSFAVIEDVSEPPAADPAIAQPPAADPATAQPPAGQASQEDDPFAI